MMNSDYPDPAVCTQSETYTQPALCVHHNRLLLGPGKSNAARTKVVNRVPPPQECVAEDGKGSDWLREVHAHEGRDAGALNLEDVVVGGNGEVVTGQSEREIGKRPTLRTVNGVLTVVRLLRTNLFVTVILLVCQHRCAEKDPNLQQLGQSGWQGDERSTGIEYHTGVIKLGSFFTESDSIKFDFPVSFTS